jgi:hypothetical protein
LVSGLFFTRDEAVRFARNSGASEPDQIAITQDTSVLMSVSRLAEAVLPIKKISVGVSR